MTVVLARYRRHSDSTAEPLEVEVHGATYDEALAEARARTADGDDLLSVLVTHD